MIFLGRIFGVADGAIGAYGEPFRMIFDPRVVGRALQGEIEGDLDAELVRAGHERTEVLERPEVGVHRVMAALGRATSAIDYVRAVEKMSGARISAVGVGPSRDATVVVHPLI